MKRTWLSSLALLALLALAIQACAPAATPAAAPKAQESTAAKSSAPAAAPKAQESTAAKSSAPAPDPKAVESKETKPQAAAPKAAPKALEKVVIQVPVDQADYLPLRLGVEKGIYREEGLDPEVILLKGELALPALLKGEVGYVSVLSRVIAGAMQGEPVKVVMGRQTKAGWHYITAPGITSPQQLKGKNVAISTRGGIEHYAMILAVKKLGLDPDKDVVMMPIPTYPQQLAALKSGSVAMAGLLPPENDMAVRAGMKEVLFAGDLLDLPYGGMGTTDKLIRENRDQVKRVAKAFLRGMAYVRDNKAEAVEYSMKKWNLSKESAEPVVTDIIKLWAFDGALSEEGLKNQLGIWQTFGGPLKDSTLAQVKASIDYDLIKEIQKELGLTK